MSNRRLGYYIGWAMFISALFLPKLNFVDLGGSTYIRLDDFLVALFAIFFVAGNYSLILRQGRVSKWLTAFFAFIGFSVLSVFVNGVLYQRIEILQGLLYTFRHVEYFLYIYAGVEFARRGVNAQHVMTWLVWYLASLVLFQQFGILDTFSAFSNERASANTAGPFELAVIASFLLVYFVTEARGRWIRAMTAFAALGLLLLTQSRITLWGTLAVLAGWYFLNVKGYRSKYFVLVVVVAALSGLIYSLTTPESSGAAVRFAELLNTDFGYLWHWLTNAPLVESSSRYFELAYDDLLENVDGFQGDASAFIRFYRWSLLIFMVLSSPVLVIFGAGPSFASVAVDGYYVRLLAETGVFGLIAYAIFVRRVYRASKASSSMRYYVIVLAVTAVFIDIFTSSKAMFLFWFWFGYAVLGPSRKEHFVHVHGAGPRSDTSTATAAASCWQR